jgi:putative ABC transport system permease protein
MNPLALVRVVRSEIRSLGVGGTVLLFVVVALASASLVAGLESGTRAGDRWDAAFAEANGAHVTLYGQSADVLAPIVADERVVESSHAYRFAPDATITSAAGDDGNVDVRAVAADDLPTVATPLLRAGRWASASDEAVVDRALALDLGIGLGDDVRLGSTDDSRHFTVVGIAVDLIDCFFPQCDPVPVWVEVSALDDLDPSALRMQQFLRLEDPNGVDAFVTDVLARGGVGTMDWRDTRADTLGTNGFFSAFLSGFAVFIMIAAAVVVAGAISARVVARRRDLGLLKAVGFTPRQVTTTIMATYATLAAVAAVVGWVAGGTLSGPLQLKIAQVLGHSGATFPIRTLVVAVIVVEVIVALATLVPAWRTGHVSTTAALSSVAERGLRRSLLSGIARRAHAGPVSLLAIRSAIGRRTRAALTVTAIMIGVIAAVVTVGFQSTIDRVVGHPAVVGSPEDLAVGLETARAPAVERVLRDTNGVASVVGFQVGRATVGDIAFLAKGLSGDVTEAGYAIGDGRMFAGADEGVAGYGLLDLLGIGVGDRLTITMADRTRAVTIVGWYQESEDGGEVLLVPAATLGAVAPGSFLVHVADGADSHDVARSLQATLGTGAVVRVNDVELGDEFDAFRLAFLLVTALALLLAMANLSATMLLAVRERAHDLGVLRAVGMTPRQVAAVSGGAAALLGAGAALLGIGAGSVASRALLESVGEESGIGPGLATDPAAWAVVATVVATLAVCALLGVLFARRPATMSVSDLIRYE